MNIITISENQTLNLELENLLATQDYVIYPRQQLVTLNQFSGHQTPDLVLIDTSDLAISHQEFITNFTTDYNYPFVILNAQYHESDVVTALRLGAEDILPLPYRPKELIARINAIVTRLDLENKNNSLSFNDQLLEIFPESQKVLLASKEVTLTRSEFQLLLTLAKNPNKVFTRTELMESLKGMDFLTNDRAVDSHIKNLRSKIEDNPRKPEYITTVHGSGYRFGQ